MAKTLSTYTIVRNAVESQYPFLECARSCLGVADQVVFVVGMDEDEKDDGTWETLIELQGEVGDDRLVLSPAVWKPDDKTMFAFCKEVGRQVCTGNWNLTIGADEVIHERDYHIIRALIRANVRAYRFPRIRFHGDYFTEAVSEADTGGHMYLYNANYVRFSGIRHEFREADPDGLVHPDRKGRFDEGFAIPQVRIFHYRGVGDEGAADPESGGIGLLTREWSGGHPAVMEGRIQEWLKKER